MQFKSVIDKVNENHIETREQIAALAQDQDDKHLQNSKILQAIDTKVGITNGKVKRLEKWQAAIVMAGSVALFMGGIIIGLVVYIYQYQLDLQTTRVTNLRATVQTLQQAQSK